MKNISILILKNAVVASIADCQYVFIKVNEFLIERGRKPMFNIRLVGLSKEAKLNNGSFSINVDLLMDEAKDNDLIIIPSLTGNMVSSTYLNKDFAYWMAQQYKEGAEIASLCTGAFLLAFTGLIKDKKCTTHWHYANEFKHINPSVELVDERVITDQSGLYSSGGNNAYWNLLIHLIEKYAGREIAIYTSKYFVIDIDRDIQSPFIIFHGQKDHEDNLIKEIQEFIEQHYKEKIIVNHLADKFHISRRTFERRFKKATRNTVAEYIQRVKMEGAKKQLEIGRKSIGDVMFDVGYSDAQTFRDVFKRITGLTPIEYRNKYNNEG